MARPFLCLLHSEQPCAVRDLQQALPVIELCRIKQLARAWNASRLSRALQHALPELDICQETRWYGQA